MVVVSIRSRRSANSFEACAFKLCCVIERLSSPWIGKGFQKALNLLGKLEFRKFIRQAIDGKTRLGTVPHGSAGLRNGPRARLDALGVSTPRVAVFPNRELTYCQ